MFLVPSPCHILETNVAVPQVWVPHGVGFLNSCPLSSFGGAHHDINQQVLALQLLGSSTVKPECFSHVVPTIVPAHQSIRVIIRFGR